MKKIHETLNKNLTTLQTLSIVGVIGASVFFMVFAFNTTVVQNSKVASG